MSKVLVYLEADGGVLRKPAIEGLGAGAALAKALGAELHGVVTGADVKAAATAAAAYGATAIHAAEGPTLATTQPAPHARAVAALAREIGATHLLFPATVRGRDLLALVAGRLGGGVAADATKIEVAAGRVQVTRPVYAGKAVQVVALKREPFCIGLRPNAFAQALFG